MAFTYTVAALHLVCIYNFVLKKLYHNYQFSHVGSPRTQQGLTDSEQQTQAGGKSYCKF